MKTMHCIDMESPLTGKVNSMFMLFDWVDFIKWKEGHGLIQDCLPYLSAGEREFLKTGYMPEEWGQAFGNEG